MHFLLYLRLLKGQLKTSLQKYAAINNKKLITSESINSDTSDSNGIKLKCEKAVQEVQYIKSFTPWPITEVKKPVANIDIIYLNNSRLRRKVNSSNNTGTPTLTKKLP
ncbi:hypothetical protein [Colwellia ponticola]|uniref:Uncharacterized protein n=1 Tax=Colwellia ponticola TaxID=2304625 RepID=A0A8H2JPD8_9GAMM|nr:hypothetical protein [Colwellia ponticola]TMM46298.1 hypothetical protein FCS21_04850 [Colwellia ponticola]